MGRIGKKIARKNTDYPALSRTFHCVGSTLQDIKTADKTRFELLFEFVSIHDQEVFPSYRINSRMNTGIHVSMCFLYFIEKCFDRGTVTNIALDGSVIP
jgi:hypothetical protein